MEKIKREYLSLLYQKIKKGKVNNQNGKLE